MNFNDDFLKRQADPNDLATIVQRQGSAIEQQGQAFVRMQRLDEAATEIGEIDVDTLWFGDRPGIDTYSAQVRFVKESTPPYLDLTTWKKDSVGDLTDGFSYLHLYPGAAGDDDTLIELGGASGGNIGGAFLKVKKVGGVLTVIINEDVNPIVIGGGPKVESNPNNIFQVAAPGGISAFAGTIASLPGGAPTTLTYNVVSGQEGAMVPAATTQLAKMRLYNTTRGTSALILNCVTGTNTLTLTANVPAGWQVGDTITIASQTVSGGGLGWVDLEITSGPTGRIYQLMTLSINSATVGDTMRLHPFEAAFSASKYNTLTELVANQSIFLVVPQKVTANVFSLSWTGTPAAVTIREAGYLG